MVAVYLISKKRKYPKSSQCASFRELVWSLLNAFPPLGSIIIIVGGILLGIFTPTEAAVVASIYALMLGLLVFRDLKLFQLPKIFWETVQYTTRIMFIIAVAAVYAYALTLMRVPQRLSIALGAISAQPWLFFLVIHALLLLLGCFMESISIMILVVPILLPIIRQMGIEPVHFGVVMTLNLMIGLLTPPMGLSLYSVSAISKIPIQQIIGELWPYVLALIGVLIVITFVPSIVTWLPMYLMLR